MRQGNYYTVGDLANLSGQPRCAVTDAVKFLTKYGFIKRLGIEDALFTRTAIKISPADTLNILQNMTNM